MQNLTLGKKGIKMLLFGLVLLTTSFSSFGQENCPTVSNTNQEFCYLATVADLDAQANGDGVRWYRTPTSVNAIPSGELLETKTYYAGNNSGNCTSRIAVNLNIDNIGAPTADFGNTYAPCEFSPGGTSTAQNLIASVNGNSVEIYDEEFTGSPLALTTPLIEGSSYFAGQRNPSTNCPSSRLALRYDPVLAEAPTAAPSQTFCPGATVADLDATGAADDFQAIRWYSTSTSNPMLNNSTPLINGETYYASQIVNREDSALPPCESIDRFEVTVTLEGEIPIESAQSFCVDSDDSSTTPKVEDLASPYGTPFFADSAFTNLLDPQVLLIDGEDYFTANGDDASCETTRVVVEFVEIPNAGSDVNDTVCQSELANSASLITRFNSLLVDRDLGGTFTDSTTPELIAQFSTNPVGVFTTTYTVSNGGCTDSAIITVTVIAPTIVKAGNIDVFSVCTNDAAITLSTLLSSDATTGGAFTNSDSDTVENFDPSTIGVGNYSFTYTVMGNTDDCTVGSDTEDFTITVNQAPDAGENGSIVFRRDEPATNLVDYLTGTPDTGGTFSPGNADGSFDPATGVAGDYTYTVSNSDCSDSAIVSVSFKVEEGCPVVAVETQEFCRLINDPSAPNGKRRPLIRDLQPAGATWYDSRVETNPSPRNQPLLDRHVYYAGNVSGTCDNRAKVRPVIINEASAGSDTTIIACETEEAFDVIPRITADPNFGPANAGGTFTPAFASGTTIFDPAVDSDGVYTYTSDNEVCDPATSQITIQFIETPIPANAGTIANQTYCSSEPPLDLYSLVSDANGVSQFGEFTSNGSNVVNPVNLSVLGGTTMTITYTVSEDLSMCINGNDFADFTLTVVDPAEAPVADAEQSFCLVDNNTVADLVASGDNTVWFEDEDLTIVAPATTSLMNEDVYYAATGDNTCGSPSTMVTVTMNDPDAPTIQTDGNEFCRSDNPTLQDLLSNINGSGIQIYSSLTGGTAIASTTALQNEVEYFATATEATLGCESSERLAIRVEVNFCGIPEGFSPNGDNINDRFVIPDIAINYPNYNIEIYNRWGNMVFKGSASTPDWDGISNKSGTLGDGVLPVGVYFYVLNYNDGATASEQGKLYLSR